MTTKPFSKNNTGGYNAYTFMIAQALARISTNTLVRVVAVYPSASAGPIGGTVDVQPLVSQIDDAGIPTPHGTVCGLPYFRLQGGSSAVIVTPAEGDIGMAGICDRDISSVKANAAASNPGSRRRFNKADGIYFGGVLNADPTQYVELLPDSAGINMTTPGPIALSCSTLTCNGVDISDQHRHTLVQVGEGDSGPPV